MQIAYLEITIRLAWAHSLKEKRAEIKRLLAKMRNQFNASAAEAARQDEHQNAVLAVALLAANHALGDAMMDGILAWVEGNTEGEVVDVLREYR